MTAPSDKPAGDENPGGDDSIDTQTTRRKIIAIAASTAAVTKAVIAGAPEGIGEHDPYDGEVLSDEDVLQTAYEAETPVINPDIILSEFDVELSRDELRSRLERLESEGLLASKPVEGETIYWPAGATVPELQGYDRA